MKDTAQFDLRVSRINLPLGRTNIVPGSVVCSETNDFTVNGNLVTVGNGFTKDFILFEFNHNDVIPVQPGPIDAGVDAPDLLDRTVINNWLNATNTFLNLASPTNADVLAQVKRNARAIKSIIRRLT